MSDFGFTRQELRSLRALRSPVGIQRALDRMPYHLAKTAWSPRRVFAAAADILGPAKPVSDPAADSRAKLLKQANALLDAGLLDDAITTFETVLKTRPNDADAMAGREKALAMKNRAKF